MKSLTAVLRSRVAAVVFGVIVGLVAVPAMDKAGDYAKYGADNKLVLDPFICLMVGQLAPAEVALAKRMGVSKRQYMGYLRKTAPKDQPELVDKVTHMISRIWDSEDGGAAVVQRCFGQAMKKEG